MSTAPPTLSTIEQHQLLEALKWETGTILQRLAGMRNHCMALLMLDAGLRVGEVVKLKMSDLFFNGKTVENLVISKTISKNNEERIIPTSSRLQEACKTLWENMPCIREKTAEAPVFCGNSNDTHITTRQVERIIGAASNLAFGRRINPHILRHTFATKLMKVTDIRTVQDLLGHKQVSSTQVYTHSNSDDKKAAVEKAILLDLAKISQET